MTKLHLSPDLVLPLEAATRRLAILAMSGAGKSNVAVVMAEQMFAAGIPWVAIDPKGDWWGVRSSKDGKGPGLPIPIFGGLHGDVPLEPTSGKLIGEMIVEQRLTCVLDISEFEDRQKQWGFLIDLGETLLRKNRQVLHLFLEEADEYLPQRTSEKGNLPKCLGVWQRVVKRGRFRGIGSTQITQRNASLNKDTLYMAEALIALRASGKADRDAVKGWVEHHSSSAESWRPCRRSRTARPGCRRPLGSSSRSACSSTGARRSTRARRRCS
jgi:DNA helicase HerA-like ATPase